MLQRLGLIAVLALLPRLALADGDEGGGLRPGVVETGLLLGGFLPSSEQEFYEPAVARPAALKAFNFELGLRLGYYPLRVLGVEAEGFAVATRTDAAGEWAPILGLRGQLIAQWPARVAPFALIGAGVSHLSSSHEVLGSDTDTLLHYGAGVKFYMKPRLALRFDLRGLRGPAAFKDTGTNHFEVLFGVAFIPAARRAGAARREPIGDRDDDGVGDDADECPDEAGAPPDGCPVVAAADGDGDGVADDDDECPDQAETANDWQDADGCPDEIPDSDGDGVNDRDDRCRDRAEDDDGHEDQDGCPDPDNDSDGLADQADSCPDEAGPLDRHGCPRRAAPVASYVPPSGPSELGTIHFRNGQARIQSSMRRVARRAARYLRNHPEITRVRIEGHADETGSAERNQELSLQRAQAVVRRLVRKGVSSDRLEAVGFGDQHPVDDNATGDGRRANRRVDFRIVEK